MATGCTQLTPMTIDLAVIDAVGHYVAEYVMYADGEGPYIVEWDTGNGATVFGDRATYDYGRPGEFVVGVTAEDSKGRIVYGSVVIRVYDGAIEYWDADCAGMSPDGCWTGTYEPTDKEQPND